MTGNSPRFARGKVGTNTDSSAIFDTDVANAERLAIRHGKNIRYTTAAGWRVYDGRRWESDEKGIHVQALAMETATAIFDEIKGARDRDRMMDHAKRSQSRKSIEAMISLARSESGITVPITDFDKDPYLLNLLNGTYELQNGVLRQHRREDLISNMVSIEYLPDAGCELWESFLRRIVDGSEELYCYLQRFVGYLLAGVTSEQSLHFLYGAGGNGKTVFCQVLMRLLGEYAAVASPDLIMLRRHSGIPNDVARLRGVRVAIMNETSQGSRFDEAKLKDLTGGDKLTARFLHKEYFDFEPTHRVIIRGNHKPAIFGTDEGIWRRLRIVPFNASIPDDEQDHSLIEKLEGELSGILNWALKGFNQWSNSGLKPPRKVSDAVLEYRVESDTVGRFIADCCEISPRGKVHSSVLYQTYQKFAESVGERCVPARDFPAEITRRGFQHKRGTGGVRLFVGIALRVEESLQSE